MPNKIVVFEVIRINVYQFIFTGSMKEVALIAWYIQIDN